MLDIIRRSKKSIISTIVIALCVIMMAGFGVDYYNTQKNSDHEVAATVNGEKITFAALNRRRAMLEESYRKQFGPNFAAVRQMLNLEQTALDSMINERLMRHFLFKEIGLSAGERQIEQEVLKLPLFAKGFDPVMFRAYLSSLGLSEQAFADDMRYEIALNQLLDMVVNPQRLAEVETRAIVREQQTAVDVSSVELDPANFKNQVQTEDSALQKFFDENAENYREPKAVKFAYVPFLAADFATQVEVPEDEIKRLYEERAEQFREPKRVKLRQLYLQFPPKAELEQMVLGEQSGADTANDAVLVRAEELASAARKGEDFVALVKRHSQDEATKSQGGALGLKTLKELPPLLAQAADKLKTGEVSNPIASEQGVYILKADDVQESFLHPLDKVRAGLRDELKKLDAPLYAAEAAESFLSKWSAAETDSPKTLKEFANAEKRAVEAFDNFATARDFGTTVPATIRERVLEYPVGAREVLTAPEGSYLLEIVDVRESQIPVLEKIKDRLLADYQSSESEKLAEAQANKLLASAKTTTELVSAAGAESLKVQNHLGLKADSAPADFLMSPLQSAEMREAALALREERPLGEKPFWFKGKIYLLGLTGRRYTEPEKMTELLAEAAKNEAGQMRARFSGTLIETLRGRAEIWVSPQAVSNSNSGA